MSSSPQQLNAVSSISFIQGSWASLRTACWREGRKCFCESEIEGIALPAGLKEIGQEAFLHCSNFKTVKVEDGCAAGVRKYLKNSVEVREK